MEDLLNSKDRSGRSTPKLIYQQSVELVEGVFKNVSVISDSETKELIFKVSELSQSQLRLVRMTEEERARERETQRDREADKEEDSKVEQSPNEVVYRISTCCQMEGSRILSGCIKVDLQDD